MNRSGYPAHVATPPPAMPMPATSGPPGGGGMVPSPGPPGGMRPPPDRSAPPRPYPSYQGGYGGQGPAPPQMHSRGMPPPPGSPYTAPRLPSGGPAPLEGPPRKRPPPAGSDASPRSAASKGGLGGGATGPPTVAGTTPVAPPSAKKKKKLADKILPPRVRDLVPESQAYMDLLAFERKLDFTIMRKRLDIQEALKRPMKQKRKLRIFISNTFYPGKLCGVELEEEGGTVPSWELRVEGRLLEEQPKGESRSAKRKFSSFFKSLVIELDKELYGPDNHLVEWHRTPTTTETDGFQVKRPGDKNVRCTILLLLDYQPLQFKLDPRLARLLGIHTQTRPVIIAALWQYVKTHRLQDPHEREHINCDKYLEQIFQCQRMKFAEIPQRLHQLLHPPDPIVINHVISVEGPDTKKTACYDIDVEVDDPLKAQMNSFILSTANQQEIQALDNKNEAWQDQPCETGSGFLCFTFMHANTGIVFIQNSLFLILSTSTFQIHETVETINQLKTNREFFLSFAKDPQQFISKWLVSQMRDLKTMTDVVGSPEEERRADFYYQRWAQEAVCRYFYGKVQQRRAELEQALGIRNA
ncbi:brahma-associated protein 60 isoform X1 [Rhipicephalus microplus]|uniref:brahma-associated protein 60 isoform X1 n=1 Tax=Rhipicephalus microplus TaxID=6941 RepID=UPI00188903DF|nr:SWI/SNF-related matrix-associated actin-dependent regulator of chromatin subfamily D member 1-like isoform X1 [Rhipicephalus microplus]XP_037285260.1 SWI/SNF-related matrix-associated actin-dependent regulator of chromatin subfamily D member 1-like isoform X1 [Rhipicephalus microplus]